MDTERFISVLEEAGLSPYEAQVYATLLELGTASATEIADESGVPGPRIYDVLRSLADRGYAETYEQDTLQARAHDPDEVLADLRDRADRFEAAADEIETRWEQPELKHNKVSIVKRFETVVDRTRQFIEAATHQIHLSASHDDIEALRPALRAAHDRGVAVHLSIHTADSEALPAADVFEGIAREVRARRLPSPFVALIDRQQTCFFHHPDAVDQYGILVDDRTHSYVFHWYFLASLWEHCEIIYSERPADLPIEYVDIRRLVADIAPVVGDGTTVAVSIEGNDTETGEAVSCTGTVTDTEYATSTGSTDSTATDDSHSQVAGQATLYVETDDGEVSVGGWGAIIEDIEATRIVVEDADAPVDLGRTT